jgi:probable F420-dependent oxidoreductase
VAFGIGTSSNVIVERWNGIPFEKPYQRVRDMVRFLRVALTGDKVSEDYETFSVKGFRLGLVPEQQPKILVAALREGMLRLAGREGDGAIINWLSAEDVKQVVPHVHEARRDGDSEGKEVVARIFVIPTDDVDTARGIGRFAMAAYLSVPVYTEFHKWLGRGEQLQPMWDAWAAGDRKAALAAIPDSVVDDLIVHGPPEACREHIERYMENGVTCPAPAIMHTGGADIADIIRALAPR